MAFNFGAFAGGLATAIQTQQKLNLEEKKYDDDIKASNAKLKQEENKALGEILKQVNEHNKNVSDLGLGMSKAEDETQYNTYASELKAANENFEANAKAQLDNYANTPLGEKMKTLFNGARVSNAEQIEKTTIKDASGNTVETYIPQSMAQDKDNLVLMENGRFGIAQVGQDGKIAGYQPTDIAPIKFKPTTDKYTKGLELFTPGGDSVKAYSPDEAKQYEQQGFGRIKPKIDSSPKVEVKIDNVMAGDDSFRINKDTATVADAQGNYYVDGKGNPFLDDKGEKVYKSKTAQAATNVESKASYNQLMSRLNTMNSKIKENPNSIGSIGSNPISFLVNNAQDFINIPTEDNLTRGQLDGYASTMIATIRASSGENGVMTKDDADRIVKLIPSKNDSIDMFKQKVGILKDELVATAKIRDKAYGTNATSIEDKKTLPPLDINAFKIKQ